MVFLSLTPEQGNGTIILGYLLGSKVSVAFFREKKIIDLLTLKKLSASIHFIRQNSID